MYRITQSSSGKIQDKLTEDIVKLCHGFALEEAKGAINRANEIIDINQKVDFLNSPVESGDYSSKLNKETSPKNTEEVTSKAGLVEAGDFLTAPIILVKLPNEVQIGDTLISFSIIE
jgi:hypothetical protein